MVPQMRTELKTAPATSARYSSLDVQLYTHTDIHHVATYLHTFM